MNLNRIIQYIKRNPLTVVIVILGLIVLCRSLMFKTSSTPTVTPVPKVTVTDMAAKPVTSSIQLNGHTAEARRVTLKTKKNGRVLSLLLSKGENVEPAQDIILLDPEDLPARLAEAKAKFNQRNLEFKANTKLEAKAVTSQNALAASTAEYESAKSALVSIEQEMSDTHIKAPFKGRLEETFVEIGDVVNTGDRVATVIELNPLKIVCDVSEKDMPRLKLGGEATIILNLDGEKKLTARIIFIGKAADPKTRTYRVEMITDNPDVTIPAGLTARINIPTFKTIGYKISPSTISLKDDGTVGVKVLQESKVVFYPVQVVEAKPDGLLVTGLPDQIALVTTGGDFVVDGQKVDAVHAPITELDKAP